MFAIWKGRLSLSPRFNGVTDTLETLCHRFSGFLDWPRALPLKTAEAVKRFYVVLAHTPLKHR